MDRLIYHNDRIVEIADARIEPQSAGLLYGWGVFTTLRIYGGQPFALDRHWERLARHAERARINVTIDLDTIRRSIGDLIKANSVEHGRARLTLLKGEAGGWRLDDARESELLIFTSSESPRPARDLTLTISPLRLHSSGPLSGVKQTSLIEHLLALEEARSRQFSEAVLINERGEMVSASAGNLFWVEGDELYTPSLATGCIAGITRSFVYDMARRMGLHLVEGGFPVQRLLDANEVFITSTAREIAPVVSFDIKEYNQKQARLTRLLAREFQKLVRNYKIKC
ncbi:MAG TPA: aminotransferase class IV [Blastocatellia bacterium]|nr:aminotransferase class IV [Blastocatellia bacterium]